MTVKIELFNNLETAEFLKRDELLKYNVRYIATDFEYSGYDIYEENLTGKLYATQL